MEHPVDNRMAESLPALAAILLSALMVAACGRQAHSSAQQAPAPVTVIVERAERRDVPLVSELVGRTEAEADVEIRANVEGRLEEAFFQEGSMVKKGQRLFRIDSRRYEARYNWPGLLSRKPKRNWNWRASSSAW